MLSRCVESLRSCVASQGSTVAALSSILLGLCLGLLLRHAVGSGQEWQHQHLLLLSLPGHLFMRLLSSLSMPLVLPKLISAIGSMDAALGGKVLARVLVFFGVFNIAIETSGVLLFHAISPITGSPINSSSTNTQLPALPPIFAVQDLLFNMAPANVFTTPFRRFRTEVTETEGDVVYSESFSADPNILGLVIISAALGVAITRVGEAAGPVLSLVTSFSLLTSCLMDWILTWLAPVGLVSLIATQVVSVVDPGAALGQLGMFVFTIILGELIMVSLLPLIYLLFTQKNPLKFFLHTTEALLVNFGLASSIATYPVTLKCLTQKAGVEPKLASLILSVSVLINIGSYPIIGLLFVAGLEGKQMGVGQIAMAMLVLTILMYGTSGIPQDSFVTILLLCGMFNVPSSHLTSLLTVDWLIDRVDSISKTLTDSTVVAVVAHLSHVDIVNACPLSQVM